MDDRQKVDAIQKISIRLFRSLIILIIVLTILLLEPWKRIGALGYAQKVSEPGMIYIVMALGALGAFVSLQRRIKILALEDLQLLSSTWSYAWIIPLIGGLLATVLYFLFLSSLLSG